MIEKEIWAGIDWILHDFRDETYDLLVEKYENGKADQEQEIAKTKTKIEKCKRGRQTVLRQIRHGNITQADADVEFTVINKEQADWEQELEQLISVSTEANTLTERFIEQLNTLHKKFDYGFYPVTPIQKKEITSLLLDKFILQRDGRIELRFKLPVNKTQVAEKIRELFCDTLVS